VRDREEWRGYIGRCRVWEGEGVREGSKILVSMWCLGAIGTGKIIISRIYLTDRMCGDTHNMVVTINKQKQPPLVVGHKTSAHLRCWTATHQLLQPVCGQEGDVR
jgi:hypothetical protein